MLKCRTCDRTYKDDCSLWRCNCGGYLTYFREKPVEISRESISSGPLSMWRYRSVIPVGPEVISMGEGLTPLVRADIGIGEVFLKMDYLCPTGSYKDRGISVLTTKLRENGVTSLTEDSSGNAGASMASYCARGGLNCRIFVPHYTSAGKCVQIESAGAELVKVPGTREDTSAAALEEAKSTFYGSHNWSPWFVEGVKTFAYEIWEQMGWSVPDNLVVPLGQGSLVLGAYRAFSELLEAGLIDHMPKLHGVQAENCAPIVRAYERGLDSPVGIDKIETVAEGISSSQPLRGEEVLEAIRGSKGSAVAVDEDSIVEGLFRLSSCGVYVEPTSAVVVPGVSKLIESGSISRGETTAVFLSGSGLKATDKILELRVRTK